MKDFEQTLNKRRKLKITHIALLLLILIVIAFAAYRFNLRKNLRSRQEAARAAGYPVTLEELNEWYSIPLNEENAAEIVLAAGGYYLEPNVSQSLPVVGNGVLPGRTEAMSGETKEKISQFLSDNQKCLELLHKTANLKYGRYPVDFTLGISTKVAPLNEIRNYAQLLELEAVQASENNKSDTSVQSIKSIIGVADSLDNEPIVIAQLVRIGCQNIAVSSMEYAMNRTIFSDEQLKDLSTSIAREEKSQGISEAVIGERCMTEEMLIHPQLLYFTRDSTSLVSLQIFLAFYKPLGLHERDVITLFDYTDDVIKIFNLPLEQRQEASKALDTKILQIQKEYVLLGKVIPAFGRYIVLDLLNIAELRAAQAAIAVQRYRLKNDKLPDSLDALVPDYIESVPLDPFDGQEIRYKKLEKGFVIYSIGENQVDDGGKEPSKDKKNNNNSDITFIIEK